jgi:predicted amidophosphoribosyltransferase
LIVPEVLVLRWRAARRGSCTKFRMHWQARRYLYLLLFRPRCWGCGGFLHRELDFCRPCRRQLLATAKSAAHLLLFGGAVKGLLRALRGDAYFLGARWCERLLERSGWLRAWKAEGITLVTLAPRARPRREDGLPILAARIAASLGAEYRETLRKVGGRSQHGRDKEARMDARPFVRLMEEAAPAVRGARVLLLDDVDTTGTTLELGAYRLREAGAARVAQFSVARQMVERFERKREEAEEEGKEVEPLLLHLFM